MVKRSTRKKKSAHSNLKQVSCSFTITGGDDWRVDLNEPSVLEELVHSHCSRVPDAQDSREEAGLGSKMGVLSDVV